MVGARGVADDQVQRLRGEEEPVGTATSTGLDAIDANHVSVVGVALAGAIAITVEPGHRDPGGILVGLMLAAVLIGCGGWPEHEETANQRTMIWAYSLLLGLCSMLATGWIWEILLGTKTAETRPWPRVGWDWRILVDFVAWATFTLIAERVVKAKVMSNGPRRTQLE